MSDVRFDGRVVVISGAGRGMGRTHAVELARRGARVVVNDLGTSTGGEGSSVEPAEEVVAEITGSGGLAVANQDDVSTHEGAARIVANAVESFGRVDAIIHNASLASFIPFPEMTRQQFDTMLAVNAGGGFSLASAAWPHMVKAGYGRLLMILSATGLYGNHELAHYAAAKAALMGLTRVLAQEGAPHGIRANALAVGAATRMTDQYPTSRFGDIWKRFSRQELVTAAAGWLIHEECPASGEIYEAIAGRMARVVIMERPGYSNLDLSMEDVRDNFDLVRGEPLPSEYIGFGAYDKHPDVIGQLRAMGADLDNIHPS